MPDMVDRPSIVKDSPDVPHNHSHFPLKEVRQTTELFGLIKPHMVIDDVSSDDFDYRPQYRTRSYTLKAPLMQDVHRILSYVKVDLSAILPLNFEKFFTNPVIGDDVPIGVGTVCENGYAKIYEAVSAVLSYSFSSLADSSVNFTSGFANILKSLVFGELFYSRGSLLSSLGCRISSQFECTVGARTRSFDDFFDYTVEQIRNFLVVSNSVEFIVVNIGSRLGVRVRVGVSPSTYLDRGGYISLREFLNEIRSSGDWSISDFESSSGSSVTLSGVFNPQPVFTGSYGLNVPFNFGRVAAYQLAIAEYFTNDKVDHVFSAELYRQYIASLLRSFDVDSSSAYADFPAYFTINGFNYQYDFLSGFYFDRLLLYTSAFASSILSSRPDVYEYFISLFSFKRSLRYKDYFVSARTRPLAVGDVSVSVNNNAVSVVDVSRKIQVQRFLNAINHAGRRLSNYVKTLFGVDVAEDRHVPKWLAQLDELVYTAEVENTGDAQQTNPNSVTAVFSGNSSNKELHFYADLPGFIIGLTSYDIERAYCDTIDRSFFIKDRYDMFIPEMQFVGDQPIYVHELQANSLKAFGVAFGYQYRDMQYKLLYSVADGGFAENLPGYSFMFHPNLYNPDNVVISPDFIRSKTSEMDEFYLSLTGYSLGSYFHFISIITNYIEANRPMIANPKILE